MNDIDYIIDRIHDKDAYTHNHCSRVKAYSLYISAKLKLSQDEIDKIAWAGMLHDIGKVLIPNEILKKPGTLTDEEMKYIRKHPIYGEILVHGTRYQHINKIIEQHHERLDGSGYPKGLKDEDILMEAKVIAAADTFDAITSDRPYRKASSADVAISELKRLKGIHYDPKVVEALEEVLLEQGVLDEVAVTLDSK